MYMYMHLHEPPGVCYHTVAEKDTPSAQKSSRRVCPACALRLRRMCAASRSAYSTCAPCRGAHTLRSRRACSAYTYAYIPLRTVYCMEASHVLLHS